MPEQTAVSRFIINGYIVFNGILLKRVEYVFKLRGLKRAVSAFNNPVTVRREKTDFKAVFRFLNGELSLVAVTGSAGRGDYRLGLNVNAAYPFKTINNKPLLDFQLRFIINVAKRAPAAFCIGGEGFMTE